MKIQLIEAKKQKVWGWPAVVNFILGGAAAGFYILGFLIVRLQGCSRNAFQPVVLHLLPPVLVGLGFVCLTVEVGRPSRGHQVFRRVYISRMSQETIAGIAFIFFAILNWVSPHPVLMVLAAAAAMGLVLSQGLIVYHARAVTAWNVPITPLLFVTSSFATGSGLLLLALGGSSAGRSPLVITMICTAINLAIWFLYLRWSPDPAFLEATEALRRPKGLILTAGVGHLFPISLIFLSLILPCIDNGARLPAITEALAALAIIIGGASQKAAVILKAGYQREIALKQQEGRACLHS